MLFVVISQVVLEWSREDKAITTTHSVQPRAAKLLSHAGEALPLVVYDTGEVGHLGGEELETHWLAPRRKKWALRMAEVTSDGRVCVVGVDRHVTVGAVSLTHGHPQVTSLTFKGEELISSCVCQDKLLLLRELKFVCPPPPVMLYCHVTQWARGSCGC